MTWASFLALSVLSPSENRSELDQVKLSKIVPFDFIRPNSVAFAKWHTFLDFVTTSNNSDFTVVIVTVGSASGSLKAEPKECLTGKGQVLSKGLRVERIKQMANFDIIANKDCLKSTIVYARFI